MPRKSHCKWISRDESGRPSCEHGPARFTGSNWVCPEKRLEAIRKYHDKHRAKERESALRRYRENPEPALEHARKWRAEKRRKASALRQRLAKLTNLANNPSATSAEREAARLHMARLTERMIHGARP